MTSNINLKDLRNQLKNLTNPHDLENLKAKYLGKTGIVTQEFQKIGKLDPKERKAFGEKINKIKIEVTTLIQTKFDELEAAKLDAELRTDSIDVTLPPREKNFGKIHPTSCVFEEIITILANMGFEVKYGPDIENDYYNFTALNIPEHHPAKQSHDTFYIKSMKKEEFLLRTHTSNVQIHTMEKGKPPFKFIAPGRVYRCDYDATHTPMFHQIEGVYIDKDINMTHLKGCLFELAQHFFVGVDVKFRFRPSFFPFTEPSAELDISLDGGEKWLEVLGCGMVHPRVLENVKIDPKKYQGFAFGLGVERFAMLKYGMKDLRAFYEGDVRWIDHYGFKFFDMPRLIDRVFI